MKNLKKLRISKGYSQIKFGSCINVSQGLISGFENDKKTPDAPIIKRIAQTFHCSADYLLDLTDVKAPVNELLIGSLSADEAELIANYRKLMKSEKGKVIGYIQGILEKE